MAKRPEYLLRFRFGDKWETVGAVWINGDKLNLTLNPGVVLSWRDLHVTDGSLVAIPNTHKEP